MTLNCWEMKRCGREPGGASVVESGVCPAAREARFNGLNHGRAAGRICWVVAGTFCGGQVQGSYAQKRLTCMSCEVYNRIHDEEGKDFRIKA